MSRGFRLVELDCASCGAPLAAEGLDVVYYCTACYNGYSLEPESETLAAVEVSFVASPHAAAQRYLPFWLLPAEIEIRSRLGSRDGLNRFLSFFTGGDDDSASGRGNFVIPAFETPIARMVPLASRYTEAFPTLGEKLGERLTGGRYTPEDARKMAHYVLIASEVEKPDTLIEFDYDLRFGEPRLLGVPFTRYGKDPVDALFDLPA